MSSQPLKPFADNFIPIIPGDFAYHTVEHPFCPEPPCLCHEDPDAIAQVNDYVQEGLMTPDDATRFVQGKTFYHGAREERR